jgi:EAL domain-containing protein (putative c-di-GMP-specific phosphodiesterase class I)
VAALEDQRMRVALQPVVDARTKQIAFYECLLRMQARDGSMISAGEFVPIAEQLGLSRMIDHRVLELAVGLIQADPQLNISFNVSGLTATDHSWLAKLHRLTGGQRGLTRRLTVEITETTAIRDLNETIAFVDLLKEIGCRVAIDDFGAGYTSFRNVKALGADILKLDGAFVKNLKEDHSNQIFIATMVKLAKGFGMSTVAEMVGDEATAELLANSGIDFLQGYHYGMPQIAPLPMPVRSEATAFTNAAE